MQADHDVRNSVGTYMKIGAALLVFTAITVAVNQVHLAIPLAITVALIIAATKGSIVLAAFMAAWAASQYRAVHDAGYLATAAASLVAGAGLAVYAARFQRKARRL